MMVVTRQTMVVIMMVIMVALGMLGRMMLVIRHRASRVRRS